VLRRSSSDDGLNRLLRTPGRVHSSWSVTASPSDVVATSRRSSISGRTWASMRRGWDQSSESWNVANSPPAASRPALRAA
jgi:hypothetical protein